MIFYKRDLVLRHWLYWLKLQLFFTRKIKVGFGPIITGENNLSVRKWRIDPIVDHLNQSSRDFKAGVFFDPEEFLNFDLIVIAKEFNPTFYPHIEEAKRLGKHFIYDIVDNPNSGPPYDFYYKKEKMFMSLMDGFILSSPLHQPTVPQDKPSVQLEHPIIHSVQIQLYSHHQPIRLLAHGAYQNLNNLGFIEDLLPELSQQLNRQIILVYHSEKVLPDTEHVHYIEWTVENSFKVYQESDIAISIKKLHLRHQRTKPSTKLISFMAAGLPVICTPTVADRLVMRHGIDGYFAYHPDDFKRLILKLASNDKLRQQIGRAARKAVSQQFSVPTLSQRYEDFFKEVLNHET